MNGRTTPRSAGSLQRRAARGMVIALLALGGLAARAEPAAPADLALWQTIAGGGHVLLIRHAATEPGVGDPPEFRLADCRTQRNLSDRGRADARRLGEAFRTHRVPVAAVRSSPWCRCLETARLAFGDATPWPALSSLYHDDRHAAAQRAEVLAQAARVPEEGSPQGNPQGNLVLVTHNVNIRALTGVSAAPGEVVVTRPARGQLELVGRLRVTP